MGGAPCEDDGKSRQFVVDTYDSKGPCGVSNNSSYYQRVQLHNQRGNNIHIYVHCDIDKGEIDLLNGEWQDTDIDQYDDDYVDFEIKQSSANSTYNDDTLELNIWFCSETYSHNVDLDSLDDPEDIDDEYNKVHKIGCLSPDRILS